MSTELKVFIENKFAGLYVKMQDLYVTTSMYVYFAQTCAIIIKVAQNIYIFITKYNLLLLLLTCKKII